MYLSYAKGKEKKHGIWEGKRRDMGTEGGKDSFPRRGPVIRPRPRRIEEEWRRTIQMNGIQVVAR